jgi:hypothetical protein
MKEFIDYAKSIGIKSIDIDTLCLISTFLKKQESKQSSLNGVVASLPSKDEMYLRELQEFKEVVKIDAAVSRIDFGAGFVKCYNWMVESRKSKG